jgi:hypothetical protein
MNATKISLVTAVTLVAFAIGGGAVFIGSGVYNIGADDHHTKLTLAMIEQLRERSIEARIRALEIHAISDPSPRGRNAMPRSASGVTWHPG